MIHQNDTTLLDGADSGTLIAQVPGVGSWELLPVTCPLNPIHAALLRTGKVLFIAGSGNYAPGLPDSATYGDVTKGAAVFNVSTRTFSVINSPVDSSGLPWDLFCVAHAFLPDGRLLCAGGTDEYDPFLGSYAAGTFNPSTEQWTSVQSMATGRWYPTLLTLGNGRILAMTGLDGNSLIDKWPEFYDAPTNTWTYFNVETSPFPMYCHVFLMQDGKLFFSGGAFGYTGVSPRIMTLPPGSVDGPPNPGGINDPITETPVSGQGGSEFYRDQAASVLLPPAQDQKVMIIGGSNGFDGLAINNVHVVDLKASTPTYGEVAPLNFARMHHNAVLLPDRTVLVVNGSAHGEDGAQATQAAEIYNPATNTWTVAATANVTNRLYHSVALLLPDGRVLTAGGNPDRNNQERRLEIYSPPYMSQPRPTISSAPGTVGYGQSFNINTSQASTILEVSLIKPMATTHCLETEQRLVNLPIVSKTSTRVRVSVTSNRNIAPPGYYMLFITNNSKVPSVAKWIKLA